MLLAIAPSSLLSSSAKSGTFLNVSAETPATAQLYTAALLRASAAGLQRGYAGARPRRRLLARLAQPGGRTIGLPRGGGRPADPARLRARSAAPPAEARAVAPAGRDRDHALPPRPLGRPRAVGVRRPLRRGTRAEST